MSPELSYTPSNVVSNTLWRPINSAPRDGRRILLKSRNSYIADGTWNGRSWIWPYIKKEPMYWMPIPN